MEESTPTMSENRISHLASAFGLSLGKLLSQAEKDVSYRADLNAELSKFTGRSHVIGVTGAAGVGKSSIINKLTQCFRSDNHRVAILSVDPSSPVTGGALLGDRIRMSEHYLDEGVFIRSLATRGQLGGLSSSVQTALSILDVAGYDVILIETVGTGQADVDLGYIADTVVLVLLPDSGDMIQFLKAGSLETADIYVVNKSDRGNNKRILTELNGALTLNHDSHSNDLLIMETSAITRNDTGIKELATHLERINDYRINSGGISSHRETKLKGAITTGIRNAIVAKLLDSKKAQTLTLDLIQSIQIGDIDIETGISRAVDVLWGNYDN
jgi:LAO/AO transport system kinase